MSALGYTDESWWVEADRRRRTESRLEMLSKVPNPAPKTLREYAVILYYEGFEFESGWF